MWCKYICKFCNDVQWGAMVILGKNDMIHPYIILIDNINKNDIFLRFDILSFTKTFFLLHTSFLLHTYYILLEMCRWVWELYRCEK